MLVNDTAICLNHYGVLGALTKPPARRERGSQTSPQEHTFGHNSEAAAASVHGDPRPITALHVGDIQAAYREKAKTTHPDRGGSATDFEKLHEAYERAQEYVRFHLERRQWLAGQVERYAAQNRVVNEVRRLGGTIEVEQFDWIRRSFGDFAVVTEMLRG